jgi:hypothetical protein
MCVPGGRGRSYRYVYMDVCLPGDFSQDEEEYTLQAIREAGERMRTWAIPAIWTARLIEGTIGKSYEVTFRVCRKSRRLP